MFGIQYNNNWLKLSENSVLSTTSYSQLINENKLRGTFTIPLKVPIAGNETFFENRFYLKSLNGGQSEYFQVVKVYIDKIWWLTGKLILLSNNGETLSVNLIVGLPGISTQNKKLQDLTWNKITLPSSPDSNSEMSNKVALFKTRISSGYSETDYTKSYTFPLVKNAKFYGLNNENNSEYLGIMNNYDPVNEFGFVQNVYKNKNAICPMVYVIEILKRGFNDAGYKFNWDLLPDDFKRLVQYNNYELSGLRNIHGARGGFYSDITSLHDALAIYGPIVWDDQVTSGNYFWAHLLDDTTGKYTIKREGRYRIEYEIPYHIIDTGVEPGWDLTIWLVNTGGTFLDTEVFTLSSPTTSGVAQKRIFLDFEASDLNDTLSIMYRFSGPPGGTTPSVVLEVGSWFRVTCITNPTVNFFGPWIDLSKCVPQDVLFKDYVNAIAATYNIEFVVNDNEKIVTLKLNEPDISAEPEHKEALWQNNAEKPIIEFRDAKYKYLDYAWSGSDSLFGNNFKSYPAADYIGEVGAYWQIVLDYEADETYANKKLRVYSENKIYVCEFNEDTSEWEWVPYSDDYLPVEVGSGAGTLLMPISPLLMSHHAFDGFELHVPIVEMEGYSPSFKMQNKDVGLRVIFFFGLVICETPGGDVDMIYSYINSYEKTPSVGGPMEFTFTLEISRDYSGTEMGMLSFWKNSIAVMNLTRKVIKKFTMQIWEIMNWSFRKRVYMGGAVMMPEQLTVTTKFSGTEMDVEMELGLEEVVIE